VRRHDRQEWIVDRGAARVAGGPALVDLESPPQAGFSGPVAVLIGPGTMNAGEDVAVAFAGRARTRFFGAATAGFPISGVHLHRLSDGAVLGILDTRDADRTGRVHRGPIEPETEPTPGSALDAAPGDAIEWLLDEHANPSPHP
jgi:hypothetical protein